MPIQVQGPDGVINQFPDGTDDKVIEATLQQHYRTSPPIQAADKAAVHAAAKQLPEPHRRGVLERLKDDFVDTFNTSSVANLARMVDPGNDGLGLDDVIGGVSVKKGSLADKALGAVGVHVGTDKLTPAAQAEKDRRAAFEAKNKTDSFTQQPTLAGKVVHGGAALVGTLAGAAVDPVSYVTGGRTILQKALTQGAVAGGVDALTQGNEVEQGIRKDFSPVQTALSAAAGGLFTGIVEGAPGALKAIKKRFDATPLDHIAGEMKIAEELHAPALHEGEVPVTPDIKALPAPEKPAAEAPQAKQELVTTEAPKASEGGPDAKAGAAPEEPSWDNPGWGKSGSPERAAAAAKHLETLRKAIKPEMIAKFVEALDSHPNPDGHSTFHPNEDYIDRAALRADPTLVMDWITARSEIFRDVYAKAGDDVQSNKATRAISHLFNSNQSDVIKAHADWTGEGGAAARLMAIRDAAMGHADYFAKLLTEIKKGGPGAIHDRAAELAQAAEQAMMYDAMAAGAASEAGRSLQILKTLAKPRALKDDMQALLNSLNASSPEEAAKVLERMGQAYEKGGMAKGSSVLRKARKMGAADYIGYITTGALLSAPFTHIRNLMGTPMHMAMLIGERYVAASVSSLRSSLGRGSVERVTFSEANAYVAGIGQSIQEAARVAAKAFIDSTPQDGVSSNLLEGTAHQVPFAFTPEAADRRAKWMKEGKVWYVGADLAMRSLYSTTRTLAYRPSVAADEFFKTMARRMEMNALSYREAHYRSQLVLPAERKQVFKETLKAVQEEPTAAAVEAARKFFKDTDGSPDDHFMTGSRTEEMANILKSIDIRQAAIDHAHLMTFQTSGPAINKLNEFLRMVPLLKYGYVPFLRTPAALLKVGMIDRNPLLFALAKDGREGFGQAISNFARQGEETLARGGAEGDLFLAKMTTGMGFLATAWGLWNAGNLIGKRSTGEKEDGRLDYSIKIGDTWHQFTPLSPLAEPLGLVADVAEAMRYRDMDEEHRHALFGALSMAVINNTLNKTFLSGFNDLMTTLEGPGYGQTPEQAGASKQKKVSQTIVAHLPFSSFENSIVHRIDPVHRDARTLLEMIEKATPLLSESLPAMRDFMGKPLIYGAGETGPFQAVKSSKVTTDSVKLEEARLATKVPGFVIDKPTDKFLEHDMTMKEKWRLAEVQGQLVKDPNTGKNMEETLKAFIQDPQYKTMPPMMQAQSFKRIVSGFRAAGRGEVMNPKSPFYMGEMVKRTGALKLEGLAKNFNAPADQTLAGAEQFGIQPGDPEMQQLQSALNFTE